ncbi:MAG: stage III sporulation protein AB [Clostridia bacterium]|nr:stage III sporulation protein AB [Clostridia bacterium]MBQ8792600.1 stage III sporulation protein AB [Clostridia bacterium]
MKIFIIAVLCCIALYLGYFFSRKYRHRYQFFQAIVMLCQKFDVEINYSKERIKNILINLDEKHKNKLFGLDKNFLAFLNQESELNKEQLFKNISFLKADEKDILFIFFKSLGRSDLDSQSKEIQNYLSRFESICQSAEAENKKYGSLSIKLGIVASLFIIILFI